MAEAGWITTGLVLSTPTWELLWAELISHSVVRQVHDHTTLGSLHPNGANVRHGGADLICGDIAQTTITVRGLFDPVGLSLDTASPSIHQNLETYTLKYRAPDEPAEVFQTFTFSGSLSSFTINGGMDEHLIATCEIAVSGVVNVT